MEGMVLTYRGKRVDEMTREELLAALNWAAIEIERLNKERTQRDLRMIDSWRRGGAGI